MAADATAKPTGEGPKGLDFFHDVTMKVTVEFARTTVSVRKFMELKKGSVLELDKLAGEPLDIRINGKLVARGEAVIVNDRFGIRVPEIISPEDMYGLDGPAKK